MAGIALIAAIGIFAIGVFVGVVAMVSHGIHREQQRYEEARRYREDYGILDGSDSTGRFIPVEAPDGVSMVARSFNGLYVRRPAAGKHDAELATLA
jgi:hypothetical protein